jgi:hypothetical protein
MKTGLLRVFATTTFNLVFHPFLDEPVDVRVALLHEIPPLLLLRLHLQPGIQVAHN